MRIIECIDSRLSHGKGTSSLTYSNVRPGSRKTHRTGKYEGYFDFKRLLSFVPSLMPLLLPSHLPTVSTRLRMSSSTLKKQHMCGFKTGPLRKASPSSLNLRRRTKDRLCTYT